MAAVFNGFQGVWLQLLLVTVVSLSNRDVSGLLCDTYTGAINELVIFTVHTID